MSDKQLHEMTDEELMNIDLSLLQQEEEPEVATEQLVTNEDNQSKAVDNLPEESIETANEPADMSDKEQSAVQADTDVTSDVDYQGFYAELTKPFKANGREISVKDPKDIITLMQQGANYSKKMEELKPKKAVLKTLEQHGLIDNDKISFLIDLHNKDHKAIAKLVKDSGIDLYAFDTEQANEYQPQQVIKPENQLQEVLDELYADEGFRNVLGNITDSWDIQSREVISNNPHLLKIIHEHHQAGIYDKVMGYVEYEKMLGRLNRPTIEAYIEAERVLNIGNQPIAPQPFTAPRPTQERQPTADNSKKKASLPNGGASSGTTTIDIAKMSDVELVQYLKEHNL